jgi:hypothetical protein
MCTLSITRASRVFALICICSAGVAIAADPTPSNQGKRAAQPAAQAKGAASTKPRVVTLNSGVAPHEFPDDPSKVTLERRPNGVRVYHMNGQGMESMVAHVGKDGKIEYTCTDQADKVLQAAPAQDNRREQ